MEGKIDEEGFLEVNRKGIFRFQYCPYLPCTTDKRLQKCGDWCPLFSEEIEVSNAPYHHLYLCSGQLITIVDDEREEVKK